MMKSAQKALYIVSHDENGRNGLGPFLTAEFLCINSSYPKVTNDTVSYRVQKLNGEHTTVTVSMIHTIQTMP